MSQIIVGLATGSSDTARAPKRRCGIRVVRQSLDVAIGTCRTDTYTGTVDSSGLIDDTALVEKIVSLVAIWQAEEAKVATAFHCCARSTRSKKRLIRFNDADII